MDPERQQRLNELCAIAVRVEADTKVPAQWCIVPQWALESKWGSNPCGNGFFGIKHASRHSMTILKTTHENFTQAQIIRWNASNPSHPARVIEQIPDGRFSVELDDAFADYPNLEASVRDYAWLISHGSPYAKVWAAFLGNGDGPALMKGIASSGYASGTGYADLALQIANQGSVQLALSAARA